VPATAYVGETVDGPGRLPAVPALGTAEEGRNDVGSWMLLPWQ